MSENYVSDIQNDALRLKKSTLLTKDGFKLEMWQFEAKSIENMIKNVDTATNFMSELKSELDKMKWNNHLFLMTYFMKH